VFAAEYFSRTLTVFWSDSEDWRVGPVHRAVVDAAVGAAFDVRVWQTGTGASLVVSSQGDGSGFVALYPIPADPTQTPYARHVIADGFKPQKSGPGKGAPGSFLLFGSPASDTDPLIVLSGDDAGALYVLTPSAKPYTYTTQQLEVRLAALCSFCCCSNLIILR
jgi:hypothetical protein